MRASQRSTAVALCAVLVLVGIGGLAANQTASGPPPVTYTFDVIEKEFEVFGVPFQAWTFGGTVPGPVIRITQGTELTIKLRNGHTEPHSVHTHIQGYQISSDGASHTLPLSTTPHQADDPMSVTGTTAGLGQHWNVGMNPIGPYSPEPSHNVAMPGEVVEYTFKADEVGAFIYHCHVFPVAEHMSRGLIGVILVYPPGWTWNELPETQPDVGNTDAWVTAPDGTAYYEDVVVLSELDLTTVTDKASLPTTGEVGKVNLMNFRGWNDPYYVGPVEVGTKLRVVVANLGHEMHTWHFHGHNFDVIDKFDPAQSVDFRTDTLVVAPGQSYILQLEALNPGFWFAHDHMTTQAYAGMIGWLRIGV